MSLKKLGRYDVVRVLGKGAMGIVYEGRDPNLDRRVAIKTVKVENLSEEAAAEYEARFRTEARSAARLQHPNIVSVYDSDRDGDIAFLVMEFIQGDDLKYHLDRGTRYSLEQSLKMIRDLLSALDYAHKQGIVHRDVKPANLLIEPAGRLKLTDFGVARIQDSGEATRTQGSMVGTLKYMSPEQVQGQKIDSRADLFSVGVVLYQLLTDKRPFDGDNDFSIIHQIIGHSPAPPSSFNARLPSAIDAVVARALAKHRNERFTTARDFASALQSAIRRAEDATVVPPADPLRKPPDRAGTGSRGQMSVAGASVAPTTGSTVTQELELVYWKDIKDSTEPEELEGFLSKFPDGIYADLARRRLRKLTGAQAPSADATVLSGMAPLQPSNDPEATRLPVERDLPSQAQPPESVEAARPEEAPPVAAMPVGSSPATLETPADAAPNPAPAPAPAPDEAIVTDAVPAVPVAAPAPAVVHPQGSRKKKLPIAVLASAAAVVLAGAVIMLVGRGQADVAAASTTADVAPSTALAVPASAPVVPGVAVVSLAPSSVGTRPLPVARAASSASSAPSAIAAKAVAGRRSASAPKAGLVEAVAGSEGARPAPSIAVAHRQEVRAAQTAQASGVDRAVDACRDKNFIAREFCLAEQCVKPGAQSHPLCIKRNEEVRNREEAQRMRN